MSACGLLLLNKKPGFTSFESLKPVKQAFATQKAGHTGTLDKFASGLLLVLVGRAVKLACWFSGFSKEYIASISFGAETDTLDPEVRIIAQSEPPSRQAFEEVLPAFRGQIMQAPPAYSAIHINGQRAHELTRRGKEPEMKKRPVTIHSLEVLSWTPQQALVQVHCSAGTYIRSLARDIGLACGSRAHLCALKRTKAGVFRLEDSVEGEGQSLVNALRPLDRKLFFDLDLPCFLLDDRAAESFRHGRPLKGLLNAEALGACTAPAAGVFRESVPNGLLGVLENRNGTWSYGHVFADN